MPSDLNESQIFALLAEPQRRLILELLREANSPVSVTTLAERIGDTRYENPSTTDVRAIQLRLHHADLPMFEQASVVAYSEDDGIIHLDRNFGVLIGFLETVDEEDLPWSGT